MEDTNSGLYVIEESELKIAKKNQLIGSVKKKTRYLWGFLKNHNGVIIAIFALGISILSLMNSCESKEVSEVANSLASSANNLSNESNIVAKQSRDLSNESNSIARISKNIANESMVLSRVALDLANKTYYLYAYQGVCQEAEKRFEILSDYVESRKDKDSEITNCLQGKKIQIELSRFQGGCIDCINQMKSLPLGNELALEQLCVSETASEYTAEPDEIVTGDVSVYNSEKRRFQMPWVPILLSLLVLGGISAGYLLIIENERKK